VIVAHDGVRRRPTVGDYRTSQRSAGRLTVRKVGYECAVLDTGAVAVGDQASDCRTRSDERQEASGQLRGQGLGRVADVGPGRPQRPEDEPRVVRLAEGEVLEQFVEGARSTLEIQPRVVEQHVVVEVHGALGRRQMASQVTEFPYIVATTHRLTSFSFGLNSEFRQFNSSVLQ